MHMVDLTKISEFRNELMGMAILWIALFHSEIDVGPLKMIKEAGYGGVDIFFFLSGLGLAYGWIHKRQRLGHFYKRRFLRIIPTYWMIVFVYFIFFEMKGSPWDAIYLFKMLTGVGTLVYGANFYWFVPAIVICYIFFPKKN